MRLEIHEVISNILNEKRELIRSKTSESYIIYPEVGKILRNKNTGLTAYTFIGVGSKDDLSLYEEIEKEVPNGRS